MVRKLSAFGIVLCRSGDFEGTALLLLNIGVFVVSTTLIAAAAAVQVQIGDDLAVVSDDRLFDVDLNLRKWRRGVVNQKGGRRWRITMVIK